MIRFVLVLVVIAQASRDFPTAKDWEAAERAIVRLEPAAFKDLPQAVRDDLDRRQCTIPQSDLDAAPHNVIRGRFTSGKQTDIAVLCSVKGLSTILVFRGGSTKEVAELAPKEDKDFLQTTGRNTIGFSRAIVVASPARIRAYREAFGGAPLPRLDHDGVDDAFVGKSSVVRYWFGGKWLELPGAD